MNNVFKIVTLAALMTLVACGAEETPVVQDETTSVEPVAEVQTTVETTEEAAVETTEEATPETTDEATPETTDEAAVETTEEEV